MLPLSSSNVVGGGGCPDLRAGGGGGREAVVRPPARVDAQPQDHLVLGQRKEQQLTKILIGGLNDCQ